MLFCPLLIFFKIYFIKKFSQEYDQCLTVWILARQYVGPDLGPIFYKSYQQTTQVGRVKSIYFTLTNCVDPDEMPQNWASHQSALYAKVKSNLNPYPTTIFLS